MLVMIRNFFDGNRSNDTEGAVYQNTILLPKLEQTKKNKEFLIKDLHNLKIELPENN